MQMLIDDIVQKAVLEERHRCAVIMKNVGSIIEKAFNKHLSYDATHDIVTQFCQIGYAAIDDPAKSKVKVKLPTNIGLPDHLKDDT